jgi:molybdopterin/thiamine biosynthesis adenylyltransferase/rhodanese-related sulfurtransferase
MRETFVAADLRADLFLASDRNSPMEESVETGHTHTGLRGLHMFQEGGKTAQQLAFLKGFGHGVEFLEGHSSLFGAGDPSGLADFLGGEFAFEGHENAPFVVSEVHDTCFEHAGKPFGFVAGFDALAAHVADTKGKDALCRHEPIGLRTSESHEKAAMLIERLAGGHFQGRPEFVGLTGNFGIRRADDDMTGERILAEHEFKGGIELFGGHFPSHESAFGEICGQKRLADAADRSGFHHRTDALENGRQVDATQAGNFLKGFAGKTGNLVFGDSKDACVDGVVVLSRNHWKVWMIAARRVSLQGGMFFCRAVSCNQTPERYACGLIFYTNMKSILDPARVEKIDFSNDEVARYSRHLIMPEVTLEGQKRLKAAKVLCIGTGGLGSPIALYLAAAGVGTMGLVDFDIVDYSNLQRQILHGTKDVGRKKLNSARDRIKEINPNVQVNLHDALFQAENAREIVEPYDIVIDGTDNFPTRYLSNDICVFLKKPNIYGSIFRFDGQCTVFAPHLGGPCYRCLYPEPPPPGMVPSCAEGGVLGVLPGVIGVMQAIEAIKLIVGIGEPLIGRLVHFDALKMKFREFKIRKDPSCPVCSENPSITDLIDYETFCGIPQARAEEEAELPVPEITVEDLKARMDRSDKFVLIDVREPYEWDISRIPGAKLIPLGELSSRMSELDTADEIIIHCKVGGRSATAVRHLQKAGFSKLLNVAGGILAWADRVDTSMPKY